MRACPRNYFSILAVIIITLLVPYFIGDWNYEISMPLSYAQHDDIWQFTMTKFLKSSGWIFEYDLLGAPVGVDWHYHAAAQTSALHSLILKIILIFISDPISAQQFYYILNFPFIGLLTYLVARQFSISNFISAIIGCAFALTTTRFNIFFYSYLGNFFAVPLGVFASYWIYAGKLEINESTTGLKKYKNILIVTVVMTIVAISDGYYAFFSGVIFSYAIASRFILSKTRKKTFIACAFPLIFFIGTLIALNYPLYSYKQNHQNEFIANGVKDSTLYKTPFEAEVYSQTLKLMVSPNQDHRIDGFRNISLKFLESHNLNRKNINSQWVNFGLLGSFGLAMILIISIYPSTWSFIKSKLSDIDSQIKYLVGSSLLIFLFATTGGLGSLVAFILPDIRAYERFPLFLLLNSFLLLGILATKFLQKKHIPPIGYVFIAVGVGAWIFIDQVPKHALVKQSVQIENFKKDRSFVRALERDDSVKMVFNYPYSQYLSNNKYYGWGSFSHIRLNLHSDNIRWSNGPSKNSPLDKMYSELSQYSFKEQVIAASSLGFDHMTIDKTVVSKVEIDAIIQEINEMKLEYSNNSKYNYIIINLPKTRTNFQYVSSENNVLKFKIGVNSSGFANIKNPLIDIMSSSMPDANKVTDGVIFEWSGLDVDPGALNPAKKNITISCEKNKILVHNLTAEKIQLGVGDKPIIFGVHEYNSDGSLAKFDISIRFSKKIFLNANSSTVIEIPKATEEDFRRRSNSKFMGIQALQEGSAWLGAPCYRELSGK